VRRSLKLIAAIAILLVGAGALAFHPSRPLYMRHRSVEIATDDGVTLRGTMSTPRWRSTPLPGMVVVHGSGPLTRQQLIGDVRSLVWLGFAVLAYDKRGSGESSGTYLRSSEHSPDELLRRLAADAAAAFDRMAGEPDVDASRLGFIGASQAGWIIPLAAERTRTAPRFHVLLSGPAVSTGVEQYYSDLSGDGSRPPQTANRAELERRVLAFDGPAGFDPIPTLQRSQVPTLWLLGDLDESVPTFASVRALEAIRAAGNDRHTVIRHTNANHHLRDVATGASTPIWEDMMTWLHQTGVLR
jgi:dienelactone hydrolase